MTETSEKVRNAWQRLHREWPNHQDVTTKEIMAMYDKWEVYDEDMVTLGYQGASSVVRTLMTLNLPKDISILDVACGTGLAGVELKAAGYHNIDGHDGSSLLVSYAEKKDVYKNTHCFLLGDDIELPIPDGGYFCHSTRSAHLQHKQLREFTDLTDDLISQGRIEKVLETTFRSMYENVSTDSNLQGTVQIFRKLN